MVEIRWKPPGYEGYCHWSSCMLTTQHQGGPLQGGWVKFQICAQHGRYLKKFTVEKIDQILSATHDNKAINWVKALDLAMGKPGTETERYEKQPGDIILYDPDGPRFRKSDDERSGY